MHTEQLAHPKSADAPIAVRNRRGKKSAIEQGSATLSHAAKYLMSEPFHGKQAPPAVNNEALAIIYGAGRKLYAMERRLPSKEIMASWMQTISYLRAGLAE